MVETIGTSVITHGDRCFGPGVAGNNPVGAINRNWIDEAEFLDASGDLFDLMGVCVRGFIDRCFSISSISWVRVFDCQRASDLHGQRP